MNRHLKRIVIAGPSGPIGAALIRTFSEAGHTVVALSRSAKPISGTIRTVVWDAQSQGDWTKELDGSFAVVNLSGAPISQLWTDEAKRDIVSSRVESTHAIGAAILACANPPRVWLNASAIGYYGDTGEEAKQEDDPPGHDFLGTTCLAWESAQTGIDTPQTKQARLRIGVVLDSGGGALPQLASLTKKFLGGAVGSGKQWMSWIHIDDLARLAWWVVEGEREGVWNAVTPNPVRNKEFMALLRRTLGRPFSPPVPEFALQWARPITKIEPYLVLVSQRVVPQCAMEEGFSFAHDDLEQALRDLL